MKTITLPSGEYLIVDVPEGQSNDFEIMRHPYNYELKQFKFPSDTYRGLQNYNWVDLPPGDWQLLGRESQITEDVAAQIVDKMEDRVKVKAFVDYEYPGSGMWSALESLNSLSKREGMVDPVWLKKL